MKNYDSSLALWAKYGSHLLMAMPYADGLITDAQGCVLKDADGNEILDLSAGQFCSIVGHNHPKLIAKITEQMQRVLHLGSQYLSPIVLEAAAKFAEVAPGKLNRSLFLSTGTEANECALNIAKTYTRKTGVAAFSRGYHGLSLATKSLSAIFTGRQRVGDLPNIPGTHSILAPHCFHCPVQNRYPECNLACLNISVASGISGADDLAAVIVEPIISAGGLIVPPPGYLKALQQFAREHGALFIVDEAQTGFGRTGKWFAFEHHEVEPDIVVISKSAGGGFPVSGLITTDEIADRMVRERFVHLASHQSDPAAAAAVAAIIDIVREEGLVEAAAQAGEYFLRRLRELQSRHSIVHDVRGQGLMLGMELADEDDEDIAAIVDLLCARRGVHLTYTYFEPVLRFIPSLTISRAQIDTAIAVLDEALSTVSRTNVRWQDLLPSNPYSRAYVESLSGKRTLKKLFYRLYETSPERWLSKLDQTISKR